MKTSRFTSAIAATAMVLSACSQTDHPVAKAQWMESSRLTPGNSNATGSTPSSPTFGENELTLSVIDYRSPADASRDQRYLLFSQADGEKVYKLDYSDGERAPYRLPAKNVRLHAVGSELACRPQSNAIELSGGLVEIRDHADGASVTVLTKDTHQGDAVQEVICARENDGVSGQDVAAGAAAVLIVAGAVALFTLYGLATVGCVATLSC